MLGWGSSALVPQVRGAGTQGTSGTHFDAPMESYPSYPSPRTRQPGYGSTWTREVCWVPVAALALGPHSHAPGIISADLPLFLCPGLPQPICCLGGGGERNGAERCPHRHSPVLGGIAELAAPWGES